MRSGGEIPSMYTGAELLLQFTSSAFFSCFSLKCYLSSSCKYQVFTKLMLWENKHIYKVFVLLKECAFEKSKKIETSTLPASF